VATQEQEPQSSGVQELIDQLQEQGVERGKEEAERILADARQKADAILRDASSEAERVLTRAKEDAQHTKTAGEDALRLACRDAVLKLQEAVGEDFESKVRRLVSHTLGDQDFLKQLILTIATKAMPDESAGAIAVMLPETAVTVEELEANPEELKEGTLSHFVMGLAGDIVRDGLSFDVSEGEAQGVRIRLVDDDVEIELADDTITSLLMKHLTPRFRAIMQRDAEQVKK
jgi:V/A-type H+/Na+-transporting ATPase subunit E